MLPDTLAADLPVNMAYSKGNVGLGQQFTISQSLTKADVACC